MPAQRYRVVRVHDYWSAPFRVERRETWGPFWRWRQVGTSFSPEGAARKIREDIEAVREAAPYPKYFDQSGEPI
jgi:hypothetical protein